MTAIVKSIQRVSITIAAGATTGTASINAVTMASASEHFSGCTVANTSFNPSTDRAAVYLSSTTQLTAVRNTSDASNAIVVYATVIDWVPSAIASIQRGTITMTGTASATASLTFTLTNAALQCNGLTTTYTSSNPDNSFGQVALTSGTVTASRGSTANNMTMYYCLVEFASGILNSNTQQGAVSGTSTSQTATISAITMAQTMLFYGGCKYTGGAGTTPVVDLQLQLTSTTQVTGTAGTSVSGTMSAPFSVIEFKSASIKSLQRGLISMSTAQTSNTATITSVNTAATIANYLNFWNSGTASNTYDIKAATIQLTNATTITSNRHGTSSTTDSVSYEAIEFVPFKASGNMLMCF